MSQQPPPPAPWRPLLQSHLTQTPSPTFTLSTVSVEANSPVPRSRTCVFRGFWPSPDLHDKALQALSVQEVGVNPDIYESDMLSVTTDVRMEKVAQLEGKGGHAVEGVFWLQGTGNQWRVKGEAFVVGDPVVDGRERKAREEVLNGMRRVGGGEDGEWSWERQVTAYFANHSPAMRGSFKSPPPGTPRSEVPSDPELRMGQKVEDLHDPVVRANFRVVVIRPEEVERLDLSDLENVIRRKWTLVGGKWEEAELWP